jgi:hypothetical protein
MRVFNLTQTDLRFHKKTIPPNGGSDEFPELDKGFIPDRDRELQTAKVISFGGLPKWWLLEQQAKKAAVAHLAAVAVPAPAPIKLTVAEPHVVLNVEPTSPPMTLTAKGGVDEYPIRSKRK